MIKKLRKIILIACLTLALVFNSSAYVYAGEAAEADEAGGTGGAAEAQEANPSPTPAPSEAPAVSSEVVPSPDPSGTPSPSPDPTIEAGTVDGQSNSNEEDDDPEWKRELEEEIERDLARQYYGGNVGDTSVETGDASAVGAVITSVNTSAVSGGSDGCSVCGSEIAVGNTGNGSGSDNSAAVNNSDNSAVVVANDANVQNYLDFDANSGNNDVSGNVGETEIFTGDANVVLTVITDANTVGLDVFQFDVLDSQNGDVILDSGSTLAQNIGNGSGSTNDATVNNTSTNVETVTNDGNLVNNIDIDANSGNNSASKNTGGDSTIETGDANVALNVVNSLNTVVDGAMYVVNIFGDMVGNIVQPTVATTDSACSCQCAQDTTAANTGNGSDSENNSTINTTSTDTTSMTNNATVANNLDVDGNTGGNTTSGNTGGTSTINSGDVTVDANVINIANINVSAGSCDPIYFVFINDIGGDWQGQILGAAPGTYFYTSDGSIFFVDANGQLVAMNEGNGADSTNNATVNNTNTNTTDITNNGTVVNNINIDANTGDNDASKNTGGDSTITTGDANIVVNVINFINSNFSGRKVVMTLVNVFGSWLGNFVPAGYTGLVGGPSAASDGSSSASLNSSSSISSDGGGENSVSVGSQTIASVAATGNAIKSLFLGSSSQASNNQESEPTVAQYKVTSPDINNGMPVAISFIILLMFLGVATIVLRKRIALSKV